MSRSTSEGLIETNFPYPIASIPPTPRCGCGEEEKNATGPEAEAVLCLRGPVVVAATTPAIRTPQQTASANRTDPSVLSLLRRRTVGCHLGRGCGPSATAARNEAERARGVRLVESPRGPVGQEDPRAARR